MPRQARIDIAGALHHLILRGIERRKIFQDDLDRNDFLERLGRILTASQTPCYAWALMPNHISTSILFGQNSLWILKAWKVILMLGTA